MNRFKIMKLMSQILFAVIVVILTFLLLIKFNVISFNSVDLPLIINLNQNEIGVKVGKNYQLEAMVLPTGINYGKIVWTSTDPKIATINESTGYLEAHQTGDVVIKANVALNNLENECVVHVVNKDILVDSVNITNDKINLAINSNYTIKYNVSPVNSTTNNFNFISSDTSIAIVNERGIIKAVGVGSAIITMKSKYNNVNDSVLVTVYQYSNSINNNTVPINNIVANNTYADTDTYYKSKEVVLSATSLAMKSGSQTNLSAKVLPNNANQKITWSTSNNSVASVDSNGTVTALKDGTVNVIATSIDGLISVCKLNISKSEIDDEKTGIDIGERVLKLEVGKTKTLGVNFYLIDSSKQGIVWSSSNVDIASVENGLISAKSIGTCIIKAASADQKYTDYVTVTVVSPNNVIELKSIGFEANTYSTFVNGTITLKPIVNPQNATYRFLNWTTSNRNIATVDNGVVRCIGEGTVTITASSGNISSSVVITVINILPNTISIEDSIDGNINLKVGETRYLEKKILPSNAIDPGVIWSSSDQSIFTVNSDGMIKSLKTGMATVNVKTMNNKTSSATIIVS